MAPGSSLLQRSNSRLRDHLQPRLSSCAKSEHFGDRQAKCDELSSRALSAYSRWPIGGSNSSGYDRDRLSALAANRVASFLTNHELLNLTASRNCTSQPTRPFSPTGPSFRRDIGI